MTKKILVGIMFIGLALVITGFVLTKGDFSKTINAFSSGADYEFVEKRSEELINSIYIDVASNDINFIINEEDEYIITYHESEYDIIEVSFDNNKLSLKSEYKNKFKFFNFRFVPKKYRIINLYIPEAFIGSVEIITASGDLNLEGFKFDKLTTRFTSGNQNLKNLDIETDVNLNSTSGDIKLDNLDIKGNLIIKGTSSNVTATDVIVDKLSLNVTSGDVKFNNFIMNKLDAILTSGNIDLIIKGKKDDYGADLNATSGRIEYDGVKLKSQSFNQDKLKSIKIRVTSGNVKVNFSNN